MRKLQTAPQRQPPKQAAEKFRFRIRVSLQRYRKFCFVSGYRFSDTASSVLYQAIASAIPQVLFCIRLSLQRDRKFCFVSGYRFSDTASSSESDAPLGAVHRFSRNPMERSIEVPAPEGRPNLAQCFSVGKSERNEPSPGGTTQFSRTLLRAPIPTEQTFFITPKL